MFTWWCNCYALRNILDFYLPVFLLKIFPSPSAVLCPWQLAHHFPWEFPHIVDQHRRWWRRFSTEKTWFCRGKITVRANVMKAGRQMLDKGRYSYDINTAEYQFLMRPFTCTVYFRDLWYYVCFLSQLLLKINIS